MHVIAQGPAVQVAGNIQRRAAAGARVDDQILFSGVSLQQIPEDVAGRGAGEIWIALHAVAVVLGGIVPECRWLKPQRRLAEFHSLSHTRFFTVVQQRRSCKLRGGWVIMGATDDFKFLKGG